MMTVTLRVVNYAKQVNFILAKPPLTFNGGLVQLSLTGIKLSLAGFKVKNPRDWISIQTARPLDRHRLDMDPTRKYQTDV